jgi:hypothetical protein
MIGLSARARIGKGYVRVILLLSGFDKGDYPSERSRREIADALRHRRGPNRTSSTRRS